MEYYMSISKKRMNSVYEYTMDKRESYKTSSVKLIENELLN